MSVGEMNLIDSIEIKIPIYSDPWLMNGLETFSKELGELENDKIFNQKIGKEGLFIEIFDFDSFISKLSQHFKILRKNLIIRKEDEKTKEKKEVKKDFVLIQENTKVGGIVNFKATIYNEKDVHEAIKAILNKSLGGGKNTCIICNRSFNEPYKKLQQASYPFVTKIKSLSGVRTYKDGEFYSFREYFTDYCPICYFLGVTEWADDGIIYRVIPRDKSFLFIPVNTNFEELGDFKNSYRDILNKYERWSNIKVSLKSDETEQTPGKFSTLLCFYEKFFIDVIESSNIGIEWALLEIPFGAVKNIKFNQISLTKDTIGVINDISEKEIRIYDNIIKQMYFFIDNPKGVPVDWDLTRKTQETLSEGIIKDNFRIFVRAILPRKGKRIGFSKEVKENLDELIYIWRLKKMSIPKENLKTIKSVGNIVAKVSKNNLSLFYKLDKTRKLDEFWSVLREISRKLIGLEDKKMIKVASLDDLIQLIKENESLWQEIRDLLIIYSAMFYSIGSDKEVKKNE